MANFIKETSYQFLCPGDICEYAGVPNEQGEYPDATEVMIIGSYAIVCHEHMRSREMVKGGLSNRHFNEYAIMLRDNTTLAWISRDALTFKERRGVEYFMQRMYKYAMGSEYTVTDDDIVGGLTAGDYEALIGNNNVEFNLIFNPPDGNVILHGTVKSLDTLTGRCTIVDENGTTYTDYPIEALYVDKTTTTTEDRTCLAT